MGKDVICSDCSAKRSNAAFSNTLYCKSCRLLRDLVFLEDRTRKCKACRHVFAPVNRRDAYCGTCGWGSSHDGLCKFCKEEDAPLYREGIALCVVCVRTPKDRRRIVNGLRKGQHQRREENNHGS